VPVAAEFEYAFHCRNSIEREEEEVEEEGEEVEDNEEEVN
jgi:hypothetical protein